MEAMDENVSTVFDREEELNALKQASLFGANHFNYRGSLTELKQKEKQAQNTESKMETEEATLNTAKVHLPKYYHFKGQRAFSVIFADINCKMELELIERELGYILIQMGWKCDNLKGRLTNGKNWLYTDRNLRRMIRIEVTADMAPCFKYGQVPGEIREPLQGVDPPFAREQYQSKYNLTILTEKETAIISRVENIEEERVVGIIKGPGGGLEEANLRADAINEYMKSASVLGLVQVAGNLTYKIERKGEMLSNGKPGRWVETRVSYLFGSRTEANKLQQRRRGDLPTIHNTDGFNFSFYPTAFSVANNTGSHKSSLKTGTYYVFKQVKQETSAQAMYEAFCKDKSEVEELIISCFRHFTKEGIEVWLQMQHDINLKTDTLLHVRELCKWEDLPGNRMMMKHTLAPSDFGWSKDLDTYRQLLNDAYLNEEPVSLFTVVSSPGKARATDNEWALVTAGKSTSSATTSRASSAAAYSSSFTPYPQPRNASSLTSTSRVLQNEYESESVEMAKLRKEMEDMREYHRKLSSTHFQEIESLKRTFQEQNRLSEEKLTHLESRIADGERTSEHMLKQFLYLQETSFKGMMQMIEDIHQKFYGPGEATTPVVKIEAEVGRHLRLETKGTPECMEINLDRIDKAHDADDSSASMEIDRETESAQEAVELAEDVDEQATKRHRKTDVLRKTTAHNITITHGSLTATVDSNGRWMKKRTGLTDKTTFLQHFHKAAKITVERQIHMQDEPFKSHDTVGHGYCLFASALHARKHATEGNIGTYDKENSAIADVKLFAKAHLAEFKARLEGESFALDTISRWTDAVKTMVEAPGFNSPYPPSDILQVWDNEIHKAIWTTTDNKRERLEISTGSNNILKFTCEEIRRALNSDTAQIRLYNEHFHYVGRPRDMNCQYNLEELLAQLANETWTSVNTQTHEY